MNKIWENIFKIRKKQVDHIDDILMKIPIFQDLNKGELRKIKHILHQREYKKNEVIFNEGHVGLGMYIIIGGTVEIVCEPEKHILAELSEGDFLGSSPFSMTRQEVHQQLRKHLIRFYVFLNPNSLTSLTVTLNSGQKFYINWLGLLVNV